MLYFQILVFLISIFLISISSKWVIYALERIARFLGWKEFVVAFLVMAMAASLPNLFVGISSVLKGVSELSFGDIAGNNIVVLTLAVALAVIFSKTKEISAESKTVQNSSFFTLAAALIPLFLSLDKVLSRTDGILLISFFVFYIYWLFSKKERFTKIYSLESNVFLLKQLRFFFRDLFLALFGILLLVISAQGIVISAQSFADYFNISIILVGVLITGLGNALPEVYFSVISAKRGETWMILGNLMGALIIPTTLVLGLVALMKPINIEDFSPFLVARFFLIVSSFFFFLFLRTHRKITLREAIFLLLIYISFLIVEFLFK